MKTLFNDSITKMNRLISLTQHPLWVVGLVLSGLLTAPVSQAGDTENIISSLNNMYSKAMGEFSSRAQAKLALLEDVSLEVCSDYDKTPVGYTNKILCLVESRVTNGGQVGNHTKTLDDLNITIHAEITAFGSSYVEKVWVCTASDCSQTANFKRLLLAVFKKDTATGKITDIIGLYSSAGEAFVEAGSNYLYAIASGLQSTSKTLELLLGVNLPSSANAGDFSKFTASIRGAATTTSYKLNFNMRRTKTDSTPGNIRLALASSTAGNFGNNVLGYLELTDGGVVGSKIKTIDAAGTNPISAGNTFCLNFSLSTSGFSAKDGTSCSGLTLDSFGATNASLASDPAEVGQNGAILLWNNYSFSEHPSSI